MTQEPFRPDDMRTDALVDKQGQTVGRVLATHYSERPGEVSDLEIELDETVRRKHLVNEEKLRVGVNAVQLENGRPKLRLTLEEFLEAEDISHAEREDHRRGYQDQPPHLSSDRAADRASGHERPGNTR